MEGRVENPSKISERERLLAAVEKGRRAKWWRRKGSKSRGFKYYDAAGKQVTDEAALERIRSLVIPPAWRFVRISPSANSPLQAVGVDTTGRIQYKYHQKFSDRQQRKKFEKIERFGRILPKFRKVTNEHLVLEGFPREKVLAIMMRLINSLYFRVGSEKSVKRYKTFGITTLQNRHLTIDRRGRLVFDFVGKSHIKHRKILVDKELASIMSELKELGSADLHQDQDPDGPENRNEVGEPGAAIHRASMLARVPEASATASTSRAGSIGRVKNVW